MFLSHLVLWRQDNDRAATSWYTERVKAGAKSPSKSKDISFATLPAVSRGRPCRLLRTFSI